MPPIAGKILSFSAVSLAKYLINIAGIAWIGRLGNATCICSCKV